jgi:hypothetical protein
MCAAAPRSPRQLAVRVVAEPPPDGQALLLVPALGLVIGLDVRELAGPVQRDRPQPRARLRPGGGQGRAQPPAAQARVPAHHPERSQRPGQRQRLLRPGLGHSPLEASPDVLHVGLEQVQPGSLVGAAEVGLAGVADQPAEVTAAQLALLPGPGELLAGELVHGLEHAVAHAAVAFLRAEQRAVHKRRHDLEDGVRGQYLP